MVANSGTAVRADRLRPLNRPRPIRVEADDRGYPVALGLRGRGKGVAVAEIMDRWRIDDEWWREQRIARMYYALLLDDGTRLTVYHDEVRDQWFEQRS